MKIIVHEFLLSDCEDPAIYAAEPIYAWQKTDAGRWIMEHSCPEPDWTMVFNSQTHSYKVQIRANLQPEDVTYFNLKWGIK